MREISNNDPRPGEHYRGCCPHFSQELVLDQPANLVVTFVELWDQLPEKRYSFLAGDESGALEMSFSERALSFTPGQRILLTGTLKSKGVNSCIFVVSTAEETSGAGILCVDTALIFLPPHVSSPT